MISGRCADRGVQPAIHVSGAAVWALTGVIQMRGISAGQIEALHRPISILKRPDIVAQHTCDLVEC